MQKRGLSKEAILLMVASIVGFGLFQGARLLDVGSGPYSDAPFAIAGIAAGGVAYATVAIVAWAGRLEKTRGLFAAGIACALASLLIAPESSSLAACVAQILGGVGWALVNLCWMQLFSLVIPRYAVLLIACGYLVDSLLVPACVAQILGGVGWALVNLCWMQLFSLVIPRYAVLLIACGYLVDSLLVPACAAWVPGLRRECFYGALIGSWAALAICLAGSARLFRAMQKNPDGSLAPTAQGLRSRMARALVGTAVFSAMCGLVVQLDLLHGVQYAQAPATSLVCAAVASAMVVALAALRPRGVNVDAIYPLSVAAFASVLLFRAFLPQQANVAGSLMVALLITFFSLLWMGFVAIYPLSVAAFASVLLFRAFLPQQANVAGSLMVALLITFFSLLWMGFVSEAHARKLPALFVLGLPVAVAQLSIAAGRAYPSNQSTTLRMQIPVGLTPVRQ